MNIGLAIRLTLIKQPKPLALNLFMESVTFVLCTVGFSVTKSNQMKISKDKARAPCTGLESAVRLPLLLRVIYLHRFFQEYLQNIFSRKE